MIEQLIHGIVIGSIIAFVALGYALVYSVLRFINFAHSEVMTLGAYICYILNEVLKVGPFALAAILSILFTGCIGVLIEKLVYKPLRSHGRLPMLLSSLGISIIIQAALSLVFGSSSRVYSVKDPIISFMGMPFYIREFLLMFLLLLTFIFISIALRRSRIGLAVRSISTNPIRTALLGIPVDNIVSTVFFIASGLAAVAGISLAVEAGLTPSSGFQYGIWAFAVAVIAGLGSVRGIIIAGVMLGIVVNFAIAYVSSLFANGLAIGLMATILLVRPQGIFVYKQRVA